LESSRLGNCTVGKIAAWEKAFWKVQSVPGNMTVGE